MSEHIRNAEYRRFWEAVYLRAIDKYCDADYEGSGDPEKSLWTSIADTAGQAWTSRFADAETLRDIEENAARRAGE